MLARDGYGPLGVLGFIGSLTVIVSSGRIYVWAAALLAVGIAWQLAEFAHTSPGVARIVFRRAAVALAGLTALAFACVWSQQRYDDWRERSTVGLPPAGMPNVLLIVLDTVRGDSLGAYSGAEEQTPFLNRLAGQSVVFERALAPSSWTLPSHASMFTGRYAWELGADWYVPLDGSDRTLAETLRDLGYATGGFVGNTKYCARGTGLRRGFEHYEDFPLGFGEIFRHSMLLRLGGLAGANPATFGIYDDLGRKPAHAVSDGFLRWVDQRRSRPFFAFLNYYDAHGPYLPERFPGECRSLTHAEKVLLHDLPHADRETLRQQSAFALACYREMVNQLDREVQHLAEELERRGLRENTVLIVTSDHGEHFGEHDVFFHGNSLYRPAVHVPLVVSWPARITMGQRCSAAVSLTDLGTTLCHLLGRSNETTFPGQSFWPEADSGKSSPTSIAFCSLRPGPRSAGFQGTPLEKGPMFACLHSHILLIREGDGREHAYDLDTDPAELQDLVENADASDAIAKARQALDGVMRTDVPQRTDLVRFTP